MIIGVDIGGTKTLVATFRGHSIVREDRFATSKDSAVFLGDLIPLLESHIGQQTPRAISLAAPGIIDHHRGNIVRCGNLPWQNVPIRHILRERFDCSILLENDANLAGLSEAHALEPVPQLCLYLTVSTGIGTGIVVNGKLIPALSGSEAGHMALKREHGFTIWEDFASGKSLVERTGVVASKQRDPAVWQDIAERVGSGLLALIPTLHPSVIVVGGSVGGYLDMRWRQPLETMLQKHMSPYITIPPIVEAQHPAEAVLYGCKCYADQHLDNN